MKKEGKVLVIEDNPEWQDILREYLEDAGFSVTIVANLHDGLEKVKKENFHFATIDMQLDEDTLNPSEFEGWQLLKKIIKYGTDRSMPTMVITAYESDYKKLKKIKHLEGTFFMSKKNFNEEKFIEAVKKSVDTLGVRFYGDEKG